MPSVVAFRYAQALADTVTTPGQPIRDPQVIAAQLAEFDQLLKGNSELQVVFSTPAVEVEKKKAILGELAKQLALEPLTQNFLNVIIAHDRIGSLGEITEALQAVLNERLGIAVAEITSARPLDESEKKELAGALSVKTGKQVRMNFSLDPSLIAGVVARVGGTIYDGSVRGSLQRLRAELAGT